MNKKVIEYFNNAPLQYCKHTQSIIDEIMYDRWVKEEVPMLTKDAKKQLKWENKIDATINASRDKVKKKQREILDKLKKGEKIK